MRMALGSSLMKTDLTRIAEALERLAPPPAPVPDFSGAAFVWSPDALIPVDRVSRVDISLLVGVGRARDRWRGCLRHCRIRGESLFTAGLLCTGGRPGCKGGGIARR